MVGHMTLNHVIGVRAPARQHMKDTAKALAWIVSILRQRQIPFQIPGGLAAKAYGSQRDINDVDIDIPDNRIPDILEVVQPYITYGPTRHRDKKWDCLLLTLNYEGQEIDISGAYSIKIHDDIRDAWIDSPTDFSKAIPMELFGLTVPVMPAEDLAKYKKMLEGEHQKKDIIAIEKWIRNQRKN